MTKYFDVPFANGGDKTTIPDASQPSGDVSFQDGYTPDYEKDQAADPDAKDVPRQGENYFKFVVTEALKEIQEYGGKPYDPVVNYPVTGVITGSDGLLYKCLIKNGPGATFLPIVDPVGDVTGTWESYNKQVNDKYLPDNVEKLLTNDASVAPGDAFIGKGYKGQQFYGFGAELAQYYGRSATGGIELGSTLGSAATKKLISGAKEATFEQIIDSTTGAASGTFIPTALTSGGSVTLSVATGSYAKSGKMVTVNAHIEIDTTTASGDTLWIGNLPYSAAYDSQGSIRLTFHTSYPSGNMEKAWIVTGDSRITIQGYDGVNGTTTQFPPSLISGTDIYVTMSYLTND